MKKVWKAVKYLLIAVVICAFVTAFISMSSASVPSAMTKVSWNDRLVETYNEDPEGFRVYYISAFEENYSTSDGKFYITKVRCIPDACQWQLTVGCNDSTVRDLAKQRGISLDAKEENFRYILKDENGVIYSEYDYIFAKKNRHSFRRLVFDGFPEAGVSRLTLCIYYAGDVADGTLPKRPLAEVKIFDPVIRLDEWMESDASKPPEKRTDFTHCDAVILDSTSQNEVTGNDN